MATIAFNANSGSGQCAVSLYPTDSDGGAVATDPAVTESGNQPTVYRATVSGLVGVYFFHAVFAGGAELRGYVNITADDSRTYWVENSYNGAAGMNVRGTNNYEIVGQGQSPPNDFSGGGPM